MKQVLGDATPSSLNQSEFYPPLSRINHSFDLVAKRISNPDWIVFDRYAIWFYTICVTIFLVMCLAGMSGSSIAIFSTKYPYGAHASEPLHGEPRQIRSDEWSFHTPLILNQYLRPDRFSPKDSAVGPGEAGLIANAPVWHFTTLFRPEFWGFFVLPFDYAYSIYWEFKWFFPVTGIFTLLLLLTGSTSASIVGALWFLFSPSMQWQLSWASLLPDMVGLCAWIVCLFCYLFVSRGDWKSNSLAVLGFVACSINFALCAYLPHQIPLIWFAVFAVVSFVAGRISTILDPRFRWKRISALLLAFCFVATVIVFLYRDLAPTITAVANTSYPGHRSIGGGGYNLAVFGSHFFDLWKNEESYPPISGNICEATGFLWLAPITLFCLSRVKAIGLEQKLIYVSLGLFFILLLFFEILPVPASIARLVLLDRVALANRALPALALANVVLVAQALAWPRILVKRRFIAYVVESTAIFGVTLVMLGLVNLIYANFFSLLALTTSAILLTITVQFLLEGRTLWFGIVVVTPLLLTQSLANPFQHGFDTVFDSELFHLVESRPALRQGKWLVFSAALAPAGFFSAVGCNVFTGLKYVPDLKDLDLIDPSGKNHATFNQSGYLLAGLSTNGRSDEIEPHGAILLWKVNPLDPKLREMGIRYVAFESQPPLDIVRRLKPIAPNPVSAFWIYELP